MCIDIYPQELLHQPNTLVILDSINRIYQEDEYE